MGLTPQPAMRIRRLEVVWDSAGKRGSISCGSLGTTPNIAHLSPFTTNDPNSRTVELRLHGTSTRQLRVGPEDLLDDPTVPSSAIDYLPSLHKRKRNVVDPSDHLPGYAWISITQELGLNLGPSSLAGVDPWELSVGPPGPGTSPLRLPRTMAAWGNDIVDHGPHVGRGTGGASPNGDVQHETQVRKIKRAIADDLPWWTPPRSEPRADDR
ncbi:uncharacterized protein N7482_004022 [Penicillium canariense]|uniref:Uncharacterized protein n=1 Tax=Penicillium canariense TaxID=189055 RepID=A0A9W9LQ55_9EURO|nr:uncharacterized protein N7482_004022 [Penicillium canariense]KAJ5168428.1 hypothetical protein N7482_004022 [Penicillium canariense]